MSPEQHDGLPTDARSDQFSFCAALWEALYGQRPFAGDTLLSLSFNVLQGGCDRSHRQHRPAARRSGAAARALGRSGSALSSMAELLEAIDIDPQQDPAAAPLGRWIFSLACIITLLINMTFTGVMRERGLLTVRQLLVADLLLLVIALGIARWQRRAMMINEFHRGLVTLVLIALAETVVVRVIAGFLPLNIEQILTLDMVILAGMYTHIALGYLRGAWALVALCLVGCLAHLLPPFWERSLVLFIYPTVAIGLVWLWSRAAGNRSLCAPADR